MESERSFCTLLVSLKKDKIPVNLEDESEMQDFRLLLLFISLLLDEALLNTVAPPDPMQTFTPL